MRIVSCERKIDQLPYYCVSKMMNDRVEHGLHAKIYDACKNVKIILEILFIDMWSIFINVIDNLFPISIINFDENKEDMKNNGQPPTD